MSKELSRRNFLAAAIFGTVAGSAILKGDVVAGDSFPTKLKLTMDESGWFGRAFKMEMQKGKAYSSFPDDEPYIHEEPDKAE